MNGVIDFASDGVICGHCASGVGDLSDTVDDVLVLQDLCYWFLINGVLV